jgi:type II secretory pathway predicted ATPase ExeA
VNPKLLSLHGLKWNPFSPDVPTEALLVSPKLDHFGWRVEHLAREGGFALITGEPGLGKSVALRLLAERLAAHHDLALGILTRPQSGIPDFYRELGDLFGVQLSPHNRWAGARVLRERWQDHIAASLLRPVLLVDEAQEMKPPVLNELRLLCAAPLDARALLTVVLSGDPRLPEKFRAPELLPLGSRIRVRLTLQPATALELAEC